MAAGDSNRQWYEGLARALAVRGEEDDQGEAGATRAAVLLLLYEKDGEPHVVLTRRTEQVATHKGQVSLPGGSFEADKDASLLETALREAYEEVAIKPETVHVLGELPTVYTMSSRYAVTPYVATTPSRPDFYPDPFEVAEVLEVPLMLLRDPETLQEEDWEFEDAVRRTLFYAYGEHKIWGATARILGMFLAVLESAGL